MRGLVLEARTLTISSMAYEGIKTEHAGAKNRGGAWMTRSEAKQAAARKRRQHDKLLARQGLLERPMA